MAQSENLNRAHVSVLARRFGEQLKEINLILVYSLDGINGQISLPKLIEAMAELEALQGRSLSKGESERRLQEAQDGAKFASAQVQSGFPVLYAHAAVAIWAAIETFVEDLVVFGLLDDKSLLQKRRISEDSHSIGRIRGTRP